MRVCGATSHLVAAGTAIGIQSQFWEEDSQHVVALAIRRMNELLLPASSSVACKPASRLVTCMPLACIDCSAGGSSAQVAGGEGSAGQIIELEQEIRQLRARVQQLQEAAAEASQHAAPASAPSFLASLFNK